MTESVVPGACPAADCGQGRAHGHVEWGAGPRVLPLPRLCHLLGDVRDGQGPVFQPLTMTSLRPRALPIGMHLQDGRLAEPFCILRRIFHGN